LLKLNLLANIIKNIPREIKGQGQTSVRVAGIKDEIRLSALSTATNTPSIKRRKGLPISKGKKANGAKRITVKNKMPNIGMAMGLITSPANGSVPNVARTQPALTTQRRELSIKGKNFLGKISMQPIVRADITDNFHPISHTNHGLHNIKDMAAKLTA
jgi:hypothetical protein